jgi:hypothetical protein
MIETIIDWAPPAKARKRPANEIPGHGQVIFAIDRLGEAHVLSSDIRVYQLPQEIEGAELVNACDLADRSFDLALEYLADDAWDAPRRGGMKTAPGELRQPELRKAGIRSYYPRNQQELDAMSPERFARLIKRDIVHGERVWPIPRPRTPEWLTRVVMAKSEFLWEVLFIRRPFYVRFGDFDLFITAGRRLPHLRALGLNAITLFDRPVAPIQHWVEDSWEWRVAQRACDELNDLYQKVQHRDLNHEDVANELLRAARFIPRVPGPLVPMRQKADREIETERIFKWARKTKKRSR